MEKLERPHRDEFLKLLKDARREGRPYEETLAKLRALHPIPPSAKGPYYATYDTRSGYIAVGCLNNNHRRLLCQIVGVHDPRVEGDAYNVDALPPDRAEEFGYELAAMFLTR